MFVGHYSAAFAAKAWERRIPLWVLFVAAQLVDFLWAIFVLTGVEKVRIVPGLMKASALDLYYMPFTHSLVGAALWSVAGGIALNFAVRARSTATAVLIGLVVFSHWIGDLLVHRPDLPLFTDGSMKLGLGMWNYFWPELALEVVLLPITIHLWLRMERKADTITKRKIAGAWTLFGLLVIFQCIDKFGPPPMSPQGMAGSALAAYTVLAGAAAWVDKRPPS